MAENPSKLSTKHLLGIKDLSTEDIQLILETADNFKDVLQRPIKKVPHSATLPLPISFSRTPLVPAYRSN